MNDPNELIAEGIKMLVLALLITIVSLILGGLAISYYWEWFFIPAIAVSFKIEASSLPFEYAAGMYLLARTLIAKPKPSELKSEPNDPSEYDWNRMYIRAVHPCYIIFLGYLVHLIL